MEDFEIKQAVKQFWDKRPCGTFGVILDEPDSEYFAKIRERRYKLEPFIKAIADFPALKGKKVLEVGCGIGIDGLEFVRAGAHYAGIDSSEKSLALAKKYFELSGCDSRNLILADAEALPFPDEAFNFIYSWGVLHHTPDIEKAINEIHRVLKPGGAASIILYNRYSLVGLQLYLLYGLLRFNWRTPVSEFFSRHHESLGTKAFTDTEARELFRRFKEVKIYNIVTPYDRRLSKTLFLPAFFNYFIPSQFGFFKIIKTRKP